jgi:hypothetical protein
VSEAPTPAQAWLLHRIRGGQGRGRTADLPIFSDAEGRRWVLPGTRLCDPLSDRCRAISADAAERADHRGRATAARTRTGALNAADHVLEPLLRGALPGASRRACSLDQCQTAAPRRLVARRHWPTHPVGSEPTRRTAQGAGTGTPVLTVVKDQDGTVGATWPSAVARVTSCSRSSSWRMLRHVSPDRCLGPCRSRCSGELVPGRTAGAPPKNVLVSRALRRDKGSRAESVSMSVPAA